MLSAKAAISCGASLGLVLGIASSGAIAQMNHQMPEKTTQLHRIEQPLWLKGAVTVGGLALIGLELWWFLLSKPKSHKAEGEESKVFLS